MSCSLKFKTFVLGIISTVLLASPGFAAIDMFLKMAEIPGDIAVVQYDFNLDSPYTTKEAGSGMATGKRQHKPVTLTTITFTRPMDRFSPLLMKACAQGQHIKKADLRCKQQGNDTGYLTVTMQDCIISSYATSTSDSDDRPMETISLNFTSANFIYTMLDETEQPVVTEILFDVKASKK